MKKNKDFSWIIGIGLGILICLIILIVILFPSGEEQKESLTENDFQIISASWETYIMKWGNYELIIDTPKRERNWELICELCSASDGCETSAWYVTTYASENLSCFVFLDNIQVESYHGDYYFPKEYIYEGIKKYNFIGGYYNNVIGNLKADQPHEIRMCCSSENKEGEVCDTITLSAKC